MQTTHRKATARETSTARSSKAPITLVALLGFAFMLAAGCGDDDSSGKVCNEGDTRECLGPGACKGAQACLADGTGFKPCECGSSTTTGGADAGGSDGEGPNNLGGKASSSGGSGNVDSAGAASGGVTSTTGAAGDTGVGGSGEGGAAGSPPVVVAACQPVGNSGCKAGENCAIGDAAAECVTAGKKAAEAACTSSSDCAVGLVCLPPFGVCAKACADDDGCGGAVGSCRLLIDHTDMGIGTVGGCLKKCDVLAQGCVAGQACHLGSCMGAGANLVSGKACNEFSACAKGLDCLTDLDGDSQNDCSAYCDATAAQDPCPKDQVCYPLDEAFPGVPAAWGICAAAQ